VEQPELSIDDPQLSLAEKISKLRVQTLVREFLGAQELQLLGEAPMSSAIETFVEKDDIHAIQKLLPFHVLNARVLRKYP
jgi:double-strand break repair protein MRE11